MPLFDYECKDCGCEFDSIQKEKETIIRCVKCGGSSARVFPRKPPSFNLKYNPKTDMCDFDGNSTRYWEDYKKMKAEGKKPRIPALDGDG